MSSSLGTAFRIMTFGESHGGAVGVVIDGCPAGYQIDLALVQRELTRRRPGQSHLASPRDESDTVECVSGLLDGVSLGTPITLIVRNQDQKPAHYDELKDVFRPSHADYTTVAKYGIRATSGGGRSSARETIGRVAAGAVARQILAKLVPKLEVLAWVEEVKGVKAEISDPEKVTGTEIEANPLRCPAPNWKKLEEEVIKAKTRGDSVGGVIMGIIRGCPVGLGEPVFDKFEADLAKAMMSLPATKGFEVGSGFRSTLLYGSEHNDAFYHDPEAGIRTRTNNSGGIQGGITNGETVYFRVAFKPVATIFKPQESVDSAGQAATIKPKVGRHDPCVLPRAVPIVEAMTVLTVMDHLMRQLLTEAARVAR